MAMLSSSSSMFMSCRAWAEALLSSTFPKQPPITRTQMPVWYDYSMPNLESYGCDGSLLSACT